MNSRLLKSESKQDPLAKLVHSARFRKHFLCFLLPQPRLFHFTLIGRCFDGGGQRGLTPASRRRQIGVTVTFPIEFVTYRFGVNSAEEAAN